MTKIYTVQIAVAHRLGLTTDLRYLDTTVKSGDKTFAPTWEMVMGHKKEQISDEQYTREYYTMMRGSYRRNPPRWDEVLSMDEVILACYCRADRFCHRYLLAEIWVKCGGTYESEIQNLDDLAG